MKGLEHKGILALAAIALATGLGHAQSSTPLPTTDGFAIASVGDSLGQALSALPMDGSKGIITIGLAGGGYI